MQTLGLQTSSNILPNPLSEHPAQSQRTIDDKHLSPPPPPELFFHHSNHVTQQNQKTSHHFSVNRRRLNDAPMSRQEQQQQKHHNLVVSYENSIDKSISKEYSEYQYNLYFIKDRPFIR